MLSDTDQHEFITASCEGKPSFPSFALAEKVPGTSAVVDGGPGWDVVRLTRELSARPVHGTCVQVEVGC